MIAPGLTASYLLGQKLDSIPFSPYHVVLIVVLGIVGFVEGYDLALGGSLIVLAKGSMGLSVKEIRWLVAAPTFMVVIGGYAASALSDRLSRKFVMQIGVVISTGSTLLILVARNADQLIVIRCVTGLGLGFALSAAFPIAVELMPAQHRRTFGAIYEVMLAGAFTLLPFVAFMVAEDPQGFRLIALPGGLAVGVVPLLVHFAVPESPRWYLRRGQPKDAIDATNLMIKRCGNRVPLLTVRGLGPNLTLGRRELPPFLALFYLGQRRWTCDRRTQRHQRQHGLLHLCDLVAQGTGGPGCRHHTEPGAEFGALPGQHSRKTVRRIPDGDHWPAVDHDLLARWFASRHRSHGRGTLGGRDCFGGVCRRRTDHGLHCAVGVSLHTGLPVRAILHRAPRPGPFLRRSPQRDCSRESCFLRLWNRYTASAEVFFGTLLVVVGVGACVPLLFGRETVGNLESVTEGVSVAA